MVMMLRSWMRVCFISLVLASWSAAQEKSAQDRADDLANASKFPEAAAAYRDITARDPSNAYCWTGLGNALLSLNQPDAALAAFDKAAALKFRPLVQQVNKARAYALKGSLSEVQATLRAIIATGNGGRVRAAILGAAEFATMKDQPQVRELITQMAACREPEFHQFDFWIGDWQVQDPAGNVVGANLVTRELEGCVLIEHWKDSTGVQLGSSFNYYDINDTKWHQLYLDNSGNAQSFPAMAGNLVDNKMVLLTDPSKPPLSRWTWYVIEPGKVRQMAEQSTDQGKTWQITWDSVYVKQ
jgi:tetratricopeptide (TPR) repeat protein